MSPASSPLRDVTELLSRRRAINIPSDQKNLLEGHDSWAVDLRNQPHGLVHIPGHVLETTKAALAHKRKSQGQTPRSKKRSASPVASVSSKRMRNGTTSVTKSNLEEPPQSSPESLLSWPQSPPRDRPKNTDSIQIALDTTTQSSIVHETPKINSAGSGLPQHLPQRAPIALFENPAVSDESEDDMETRIPDAQPLRNAPINRTAVRSNPAVPSPQSAGKSVATPPCAQPSNSTQFSASDTAVSNKTPPKENESPGKGKPRFVFKPIDVDDIGKKKKKNHPEKERLAPTIIPPVFDSSIPASSDSIIPYTYNVPTTQESIRESIEDKEGKEGNGKEEMADQVDEIIPSSNEQEIVVEQAPKSRPASNFNPKLLPTTNNAAKQNGALVQRLAQKQQAQKQQVQQQVEQQQVQQPTTPPKMAPPKRTAPANSDKHAVSHVAEESHLPASLCIAPGATQEPFDVFVQYYPDYASGDGGRVAAGTKLHFITACVYLNYLRSKHLLRDYLYDEFIRAYPRYYKEYMRSTRRPAMFAITWFNKQKGPPVFNKYLVHRGNLSHIMRSYPEEFSKVNEIIYKKKGGDELSIYTSSEDEGETSEDQEPPNSVPRNSKIRDPSTPVPRTSNGRTVGALQPVGTIESDMDMDLSQILPTHASSSLRRSSPASTKETEQDMPLDFAPSMRPEQRPALPSSPKARRNTLQAQPESSRGKDIMTQ
ncbi:hypothetical protein ACLX1H_002824 [Fusarium chlamydosporum]